MAAGISNQPGTGQVGVFPRIKVLLVDENSRDLQHYAHILEQYGYEVRAFDSYTQGDRCLEGEPFDFVVVSQGSRAFEGRSLLEHAMMINRYLPVVVLTRSVEMECYLEAMQLGAVDYLEKPLPPAAIARVVGTHVRPRTVAD